MEVIEKKERVWRVISVIACLCVQLCVGIIYLWSVFNKEVRIQFQLSDANANNVFPFMLFGFVFGNLIGGYLQDKTNPKVVTIIGCILFCGGILSTSFLTSATGVLIFLTYSLTAGLGSGFAYASVLKTLQKWFPTRRGFASGLSVAAFGMSTVLFSPISQALMGKFPVSTVFLILGISFLVITGIACLFIRLPKDAQNASMNNCSTVQLNKKPLEAIKAGGFWCIFFTSFFINALWGVLGSLIVNLGRERGLTEGLATVAVMITGIFNAGGRLGMATLSDKIKRTYIMIAMAMTTMTCAFLLIFVQGWLFLVIVALAAFSYGGPSAIMPPMSVDLFGTKHSGTNYGLILLSLGFSSILFTWLSNLLHAASGAYTYSFILTGSVCIIPIILMLIYTKLYTKKEEKRNEN